MCAIVKTAVDLKPESRYLPVSEIIPEYSILHMDFKAWTLFSPIEVTDLDAEDVTSLPSHSGVSSPGCVL